MEKYAKSIKNQKSIQKIVTKTVHDVLHGVQELKSFDVGLSQTVASTGAVQKLSTIPQGDTDSSRNGDGIVVCKLEARCAASFADATNLCRFTFFRWMQDDTTDAPTIDEIYQDSASSPWLSPFHRDNLRAGKIVIVHDKTLAVSSAGPGVLCYEFSKSYKAVKVSFQAAATTGNGHFYLIVVTDSTASTHPSLSMESRVWYRDS